MEKGATVEINTVKKSPLLNKEIVLVDWNLPNDTGLQYLEGIITQDLGNDRYMLSLPKPIKLYGGFLHQKLIIKGRHKGYPLTKIFPGFLKRLFIFKHPLSNLFAPLVAVNIYSENGESIDIANIYLKCVYLKATGRK